MVSTDELAVIIKESLDISQFKYGYDLDEPFTGPDKEIVSFETRRKYMYGFELWDGEGLTKKVYTRIGEKIFLDDRLVRKLPKELRNHNNLIKLSEFDTVLNVAGLIRYSAITAYALECVNLAGKHVLDLGSAEGLLSIIANINGAKTTSVDMDYKMGKKLEKHIFVNNLDFKNFNFIEGDIRNYNYLTNIKSPVDVIVANLGAHYKGADLAAIGALSFLPNVKTFIGGGYVSSRNSNYPQYHPNIAINILKEKGFNKFRYVHEGFNYNNRIAFIAEKK